jgi:phosphate transport system permease protein
MTTPSSDDNSIRGELIHEAAKEKLRASGLRRRRRILDRVFSAVAITAASLSVVLLAWLLGEIFYQGIPHLSWNFLSGVPSRNPAEAGILPATVGTVYIVTIAALVAIPIGVATAILLEEYSPQRRPLRDIHNFVQLNITNLAGVPSLVYGLLGLTAFAAMFNLFGTPADPAYTTGIVYLDQFPSASGESVFVRVDRATADATKPTPQTEFLDASLKPISVTVVPESEIADDRAAMEADLERFSDAVATLIEQSGADAAVFADKVAAAWTTSGLKSDFATLRDTMLPELQSARGMKGRELKRTVRRALRPIELHEAKVRLPNVVTLETTPSRVTREQPWFIRLPFGRGVLTGGLTLTLVILPVIIIASQEAIRAVPGSLRQASLALGATQWQTVWKVTLPSALPGIMTGIILAMSRAIGEAAPILIIAGIVYITFTPQNLMDDFTAMPLQIYNWASRPQQDFYNLAAAGIILLLGVLLVFNGIAVLIRQRTQGQA